MRLVILDSYALQPGDLDWSPLYDMVQNVTEYPRTPYSEIIDRIGDAELVIVNKCKIDEAILQACPNIKWVGVTATGTDSLDIVACQKHNVAVANVPSYSTNAVAQLTFGLLLNGCQQIMQHNQVVRKGYWQLDVPQELQPHTAIELMGKTLGIIGYGEIGRKVARFAKAFDMKVLVYTKTPEKYKQDTSIEFVSLEQLLTQSDVISLHCPSTEQTYHIINEKTISQMKPRVVLLNTARGALICEQDLLSALQQGKISFYGTDVSETEPTPVDSLLRKLPNVLLTPHIAWTTPEALQRLSQCVCENLQSFLQGNPRNIVNGVK